MSLFAQLLSDEGKLTSRAKRGGIWVSFTNLFTNVMNIATTIALARWFLDPKDFGVIGIIVILTELMKLLAFQGVCDALIYIKNCNRKMLDTFIVTTGFLGFFFLIITFLGASYVAQFFNNPLLTGTLKIIAFTYPLMSISSIPLALLRKELDFKRESFVLLIAQVFSTISMIIFASLNYGIYSVIYGLVVKSITTFILAFYYARYFPSLNFQYKTLKEIFRYIKYVTTGAGLMFILNRADQFIVGKFLGAKALGFYSTAFNILNYILMTPRTTFNKVLFSTYAKMQDDEQQLRVAFLNTGKYICTLFIPIFAGIGAVSELLVDFLLGSKWMESAILLKFLSFYAIVKIIGVAFPQVMKAVNRTEYIFRYNALRLVVMIPALVLASYYTINIVAITMVGLLWIFKPLEIYMLKKAIGLKTKQYFNMFIGPFFVSMLMWGIIFVIDQLLIGLHDIILLIILFAFGIMFYALMIRLIDTKGAVQFRSFVKNYMN